MGGSDLRPMGLGGGIRGIPPRVHFASTSLPSNSVDSDSCRGSQGVGASRRGSVSRQKGSGVANHGRGIGALFNLLLDNQEVGGMASHSKSKAVERLHQTPRISHGNTVSGVKRVEAGVLGSHSGPQGCLFACTGPPSFQEVAAFPGQRPVISVQGSSLRAVDFAAGVHPHSQDCGGVPQAEGLYPLYLPGRFSCHRSISRGTAERSGRCPRVIGPVRIHYQRQEIASNADTAGTVSGGRDRLQGRESLSIARKDSLCPGVRRSGAHKPCSRGRSVSAPAGTHVKSSRRSALVQGPYARSAAASSNPLQAVGSPIDSQDSCPTLTSQGVEVVGGSRSLAGRGSLPSPSAERRNNDRCVQVRLGGPPVGHSGIGSLVSQPEEMSYQPLRTVGSVPCTAQIQEAGHRSVGASQIRQHLGSDLLEQAGGHSQPVPLQASRVFTGLVRDQVHIPERSTCSRGGKRIGRCVVQRDDPIQVSAANKRVVGRLASPAQDLPRPVQASRTPSYRSVCVQTQSPAANLLHMGARRGVFGQRRARAGLVRNVRLRLSADRSDTTGASQVISDDQVSRPADCTILASPTMVQSAAGPIGIRARPSPSQRRSLDGIGVTQSGAAAGSTGLGADGLDHFSRTYLAAGLSEKAAGIALQARRPSTRSTYNHRFERFRLWCQRVPCDPYSAPIGHIADFLSEVFDGGAQARTVQAYRAAIGAIHFGYGSDITVGNTPVLSDLIKGMFHLRPPVKRLIPKWDLPLVLQFLAMPEMRDLGTLSLLDLSRRTAFLLAVACGRRCSEIHALSIRSGYLQVSEAGATILPRAGFLAKNQTLRFNPKPIFLPDLRRATGDPEDRHWCPVRCLKFYLAKTRPIRGETDQLFITSTLPHGPVSRKTLSRWIVEVVLGAYSKFDRTLPHAMAHDIRGQSASWALYKGVPIAEIIANIGWQTETTFQSTYLKDVLSGEHQSVRSAVAALRAGTR